VIVEFILAKCVVIQLNGYAMVCLGRLSTCRCRCTFVCEAIYRYTISEIMLNTKYMLEIHYLNTNSSNSTPGKYHILWQKGKCSLGFLTFELKMSPL